MPSKKQKKRARERRKAEMGDDSQPKNDSDHSDPDEEMQKEETPKTTKIESESNKTTMPTSTNVTTTTSTTTTQSDEQPKQKRKNNNQNNQKPNESENSQQQEQSQKQSNPETKDSQGNSQNGKKEEDANKTQTSSKLESNNNNNNNNANSSPNNIQTSKQFQTLLEMVRSELTTTLLKHSTDTSLSFTDLKETILLVTKELEETIQRKSILNSESAKLHEFLRTHDNVDEVSEDWVSLNSNITGVGFKVRSRGPDDKIYQKKKQLLHKLPRGIIFIKDSAEKSGWKLVVFAHRKFFGRSPGDDDDTDEVLSEALSEQKFKFFVRTVKANGDNCQVVFVRTQSEPNGFWVVGSKHRKIAVRDASEISDYSGPSQYSYAVEMARCFFQTIAKMDANKVKELQQFLLETGLTMNFEFESTAYQHVVLLQNTKLIGIGFSGYHLQSNSGLHPFVSAVICQYFGFPHVVQDWKIYNRDQLVSVCTDTSLEWNSEGAVMSLMTQEQRTIDLVKVKSFWYVLLRAMREKLRHFKGSTDTIKLLRDRFSFLKQTLNIPDSYLTPFTNMCCQFIHWVSASRANVDACKSEFPFIWRKFLEENNLPIDKTLLSTPFDLKQSRKSKNQNE